jgi:hypothetical protein
VHTYALQFEWLIIEEETFVFIEVDGTDAKGDRYFINNFVK